MRPPGRGEGGARGHWLVAGWEWQWRLCGAAPDLSFFPLPCRLGRWWRIKEARNSVCIIPLRRAPGPRRWAPDGPIPFI